MTDNFQSSQQYDDDAVGSYYHPRSPQEQVQVDEPDNTQPNNIQEEEEKISRPDQSVKACKNIRVIFAHD